MKLDEVIVEKQLDEVPAGMVGQGVKKLGAKALGMVPGGAAKSKAANLAGQADLGDTANNLHKQFNQYLGQQGKKMAQATGEDLSAFIKSKNHNTKVTIPSGVLQDKQLNDILMAVAKEGLAMKAGAMSNDPAGGAAAAAGDKNNNGTPDSEEVTFVPNQQVLFVNKSGKETPATVVGKSEDGDESKVSVKGAKGQTFNVPRDKLLDPKTKQPFKPGNKPTTAAPAATGEVPPELQKRIDALTPEQKKQLAELL
jgi:ribosomal protein L12E/L44/L45/RPP1/RPP2